MKKPLIIFLVTITASALLLIGYYPVAAQECVSPTSSDNLLSLSQKKEACEKAWALMEQAKKPHEENLRKMEKEIASFQLRLRLIEQDLIVRAGKIAKAEENLGEKEELLARRVRRFYIRTYYTNNPLTLLFSRNSSGFYLREFAYQEAVTAEDKKGIIEISLYIKNLEEEKNKLQKEKVFLATLKTETDKQAESVRKLLANATAYQETIEASLSSLQQQILAIKSGGFIASVGDSELADDYNASIKGFRESAPAGSFAVFSFGAYTHRKGMSQYGARGRAQSDQKYRVILKAYYGKEPVKKDTNGTINVAGYGNLDFETTYLFGIAEMPSSWNQEALKAQAVAARTYAYRYKVDGKQICTDEGCQVFRKSKSDNPPSEWKQAVIDTQGEVLEDVVTYYSSTTGGYITTMGWDTTDNSGGGSFFDRSYEKIGGSPWAYKAWYAKGYSPDGDKCGRSNPWLNGTELADIVNAALVLKNTNDGRITPVTTSCWGGNPYSHEELRNVASQYEGINSVSSVSVIQGNGSTNEVIINGGIHLNGSEFRRAFNLRAPGYLRIPQEGFAFFNLEKK